MNARLRIAAPSAVVCLFMLAGTVIASCANSPTPTIPPAKEAGAPKKDAAADVYACGAIGQECCSPPTQCDLGAFCAPDGTCKNQHPSDIGTPCSSPSSCSSGICGYTQGIQDGAAPVQDGNGTPPPQATGCTVGCYQSSDCTPGWACSQLTVGEGVCSCTWGPETCDGLDNNCDGIVDNQPEVDNDCTLQNMGIPYRCEKGACHCINSCEGNCVDIATDPDNCGKCGATCTPKVQKCADGACVCAYTMCGTECIDTGGKDNGNCGGCGTVCDYECAQGTCGPATFAKVKNPEAIAVDSTNVYWTDEVGIQYCPLTGCGAKPTTLARFSSYEEDGLGGLAVTPQGVFFIDGESNIDECDLPPKGCGEVGNLYESVSSYGLRIAAGTSDLAWGAGEELLESCKLGPTCKSPTPIVSTLFSPVAITVSGSTAYYAVVDEEKFFVRSAPVGGGGTATTLCFLKDVFDVNDFLFADGNVYFTSGDGYYGGGAVYACPTSTPDTLAIKYFDDPNGPAGLATDGTNLYWTDNSGSSGAIRKCALGTTCATPTTVVSGLANPFGLAVTSTQLFWTTSSFTGSAIYVFHN